MHCVVATWLGQLTGFVGRVSGCQVTIAKAHYQLSHKEEALSWAAKALELPVRSQDDQKAATEAEALIKKLGGTPPARK